MHNPWRAFRELTHITLRWAHLPEGVWGYTNHELNEVVLAHGLNQAERRCSIEHERNHVLRGPVMEHLRAREETAVDRVSARLLLPDIKAIGDALAWARDAREAAEELWVDEFMLRARLESLHPAERGYLKSRLAQP